MTHHMHQHFTVLAVAVIALVHVSIVCEQQYTCICRGLFPIMSKRKERHSRSKSAGTKSVEYRSVLDNLPSIIGTLQANKAAGESLCLKLKQKEWVNVTDDPPPQEVMKVVLNRG